MGQPAVGANDLAVQTLTGSFTETGNSTALQLLGNFNVAVWGTFVGTAILQCSFDGGTTWIPVVNKHTGSNVSFTAAGALQEDEVEPGVLYRVSCSVYTSGTINYRISEGAAAGRVERLT